MPTKSRHHDGSQRERGDTDGRIYRHTDEQPRPFGTPIDAERVSDDRREPDRCGGKSQHLAHDRCASHGG